MGKLRLFVGAVVAGLILTTTAACGIEEDACAKGAKSSSGGSRASSGSSKSTSGKIKSKVKGYDVDDVFEGDC